MTCYWDTSALAALLFEEAGSSRARALLEEGGMPGFTSFFTLIELESVYARRLAGGLISAGQLSGLRLQAQRLEAGLALVWPDEPVLEQARRMVPALGLRPADALQLASALLAASRESVFFASLDLKLNEAAQAAGLKLAA